MIESFRTEAGEPAFSYDGRLLCSKFAPGKEAQDFVDRNSGKITSARTIFVLGLGGGHVIETIHRQYPDKKIVVIEREREVIDTVSCLFPFQWMNLEIHHITEVDEIKTFFKGNPHVAKGLRQSYCIVRQPCTQWLNADFYNGAEELLVGRTPAAFTFLLTIREETREALRPLVEVDGLATIKTLAQNLRAEGDSEIKLLIKTMRELVI